LAAVTHGANWHDATCLEDLLDATVVACPEGQEQNLCLDKGYDNPTGLAAVAERGYEPHIQAIREPPSPRRPGRRKPRRWVVERTFAWLSKCRAILVRYDKHASNYLGLIQLACALLWYRRYWRLTRKRVLR
jgi:putative transposase